MGGGLLIGSVFGEARVKGSLHLIGTVLTNKLLNRLINIMLILRTIGVAGNLIWIIGTVGIVIYRRRGGRRRLRGTRKKADGGLCGVGHRGLLQGEHNYTLLKARCTHGTGTKRTQETANTTIPYTFVSSIRKFFVVKGSAHSGRLLKVAIPLTELREPIAHVALRGTHRRQARADRRSLDGIAGHGWRLGSKGTLGSLALKPGGGRLRGSMRSNFLLNWRILDIISTLHFKNRIAFTNRILRQLIGLPLNLLLFEQLPLTSFRHGASALRLTRCIQEITPECRSSTSDKKRKHD
jgi:hypothetical protein